MRLALGVIVLSLLAGMCCLPAAAQTAGDTTGAGSQQAAPVKPKPRHHHAHKPAGAGDHVRVASGPPDHAPFEHFRDCPDCTEMVMLPAGHLAMGSASSESGHFRDEEPQHDVSIGAFAIARTDVTRAEFASFVAATGWVRVGCYILNRTWILDSWATWRNPGFGQTDEDPAVCVSWEDAQAYVQWLSARTGKTYRLPTEAEWEYAARAGTTTARFWGDDSSDQCVYANGADRTYSQKFPQDPEINGHCADGYVFTNPVGALHANAWGLVDMLGNVFEWTQDCWNEGYVGAPADGSAWQAGDCTRRVLRGGSWYLDPRALRSAYRFKYKAIDRVSKVGFRVARDRN
jgi:formylglycine-generating enzyme